jgi:hypothetical protein
MMSKLKVDKSLYTNSMMSEARAEVIKVPLDRFCSRLPENLNRKFEIELAKNGLKKQEWLIKNVKQFVGER